MPTPLILRATGPFVHGFFRTHPSAQVASMATDPEASTLARRAAMGFLHLTCPSSYSGSSANTFSTSSP